MTEARAIVRMPVGEQTLFGAEFRLRRPVVLTGGLADWPKFLFAFDSLADRFGTHQILSYKVPPQVGSARMSSIKSDFYAWSDDTGDRQHLRKWSFGDFIAALKDGEAHYCMANKTKNTALRDAIAGETGELRCNPVDGTRQDLARREFFFGSESAGPGLHHDGAVEGFLCELIGTKRINAFSPADISYLYPADSWLAPTGHFSAVADSFKADAAKFPLFGRATVHSCQLEPGDVLYLPPHWYHDTSPTGPTLSMTIRNVPPAEAWGTAEDRAAIMQGAKDLHERLAKLSLEARAIYGELLRRDLPSKN